MGVVPDGYDLPTQVALVSAKVDGLSSQQAATDAKVDRLDSKLDGRPTWGFTMWLSTSMACNGALGAAVVALVVARR